MPIPFLGVYLDTDFSSIVADQEGVFIIVTN